MTTITTFLMGFLLQNTGDCMIARLEGHLRWLEHQNSEILLLLRDGQVEAWRTP